MSSEGSTPSPCPRHTLSVWLLPEPLGGHRAPPPPQAASLYHIHHTGSSCPAGFPGPVAGAGPATSDTDTTPGIQHMLYPGGGQATSESEEAGTWSPEAQVTEQVCGHLCVFLRGGDPTATQVFCEWPRDSKWAELPLSEYLLCEVRLSLEQCAASTPIQGGPVTRS